MRKQISLEVRKIIVDLRNEGKSLREIGKIIKRSHGAVQKVIKKYKNHKLLENFKKSGRPKKLNDSEINEIVKEVKRNPRSSAVKIAENTSLNSGKSVSASTVLRTLNEKGLHGRIPRKKPFISKVNKKKRLQYAKKYKNHDVSFWKTVLFTDESKFEIFGTHKNKKIWRTPNSELNEKNVVSTIKHGGGSVMVWGCMAASGVGNLAFIDSTMNKEDYLHILQENLQPSVEKLRLPRSLIFQQDNDPKHKSYLVREWLLYRTPKQLDHPPQSPDLNPIEHLWEHLDWKIRKKDIRNKETLQEALINEWNEISNEVTTNLVTSMPRRLKAVLKAKGGPTKY